MSWKLLLIMLNINNLIIKLFLALYLLIMYNFCICIYVGTYVNHEYERTWLCISIFMFSLLFGIYNYCVIMLIPVRSFNKVYWFYLQLLPVWGFCTIIRLHYLAVSWLGFVDLYMYVYMYFWDKWPLRVTLWLYIFGEKWIFHDKFHYIV